MLLWMPLSMMTILTARGILRLWVTMSTKGQITSCMSILTHDYAWIPEGEWINHGYIWSFNTQHYEDFRLPRSCHADHQWQDQYVGCRSMPWSSMRMT